MNLTNLSNLNNLAWRRLLLKINSINLFVSTIALNFLDALKIIYVDTLKGKLFYNNILENLRRVLWTCLPIAVLTVSASSIIYAIHVAPEFYARGLNVYLGGLVAIALVREGVPVLGSLAIITQFCSGSTAQIGSMKITEQLDAMKIAKVYPQSYILVPMLLAGTVGFPILTVVCILTGLLINFFTCNLLINLTPNIYLTSIYNALSFKDILLCLVKSSIFGFVVTLVSYTCGVLTVGGSKAVGNSTRISVVINFALVVILDYIITALWI